MRYCIEVPGLGRLEGLGVGGCLLPFDRPIFDVGLVLSAQPMFGSLCWSTQYKDVADEIASILRGWGYDASVKEFTPPGS